MIKIILGTTPTIKYKFSIVKPAGIETAILTIIDRTGTEKLRKTLDDATINFYKAHFKFHDTGRPPLLKP